MRTVLEIFLAVGGFSIGVCGAIAGFLGWYANQQRKQISTDQHLTNLCKATSSLVEETRLHGREFDRLHRELIEVKAVVLNLQALCKGGSSGS